ncbi:unnamed protein product [Rhizoctonia solani]|uniref:Uncharacterized protein n=1 Tax=Rhizoctonia solani TaxID=456999 RepID=A0A8H3DWQ5_9AGAM|nr:unnamed protein product [Rhizoctonia solani]
MEGAARPAIGVMVVDVVHAIKSAVITRGAVLWVGTAAQAGAVVRQGGRVLELLLVELGAVPPVRHALAIPTLTWAWKCRWHLPLLVEQVRFGMRNDSYVELSPMSFYIFSYAMNGYNIIERKPYFDILKECRQSKA